MKNKYPKLKIVFNPEFLSRKTAKKDFENPDRIIIGTDSKKAEKILEKVSSSAVDYIKAHGGVAEFKRVGA